MTYKYAGVVKGEDGLVVVFKRSNDTIETLETLGREPETPAMGQRVDVKDLLSDTPSIRGISKEAWLDARIHALNDILESSPVPPEGQLSDGEVKLLMQDRIVEAMALRH